MVVRHVPGKLNVVTELLSRWASTKYPMQQLGEQVPNFQWVPISKEHMLMITLFSGIYSCFIGTHPALAALISKGLQKTKMAFRLSTHTTVCADYSLLS